MTIEIDYSGRSLHPLSSKNSAISRTTGSNQDKFMIHKSKTKSVYKPQKPWIETPLIESAVLSKKAGCRIFLKLENLQPGGSFKSRAMGNLILYHINNPENAGRQLHFFINSGGNAGLAAVCAARSLSYPCTVVLPVTTSRLMVDKLCAAGATQVIQHGETIAAAGEYMKEVLMNMPDKGKKDAADINGLDQVKKIALHPFDHSAIWEGNSTIVDELARQLPVDEDEEYDDALPVDALVCSVGGGGLMNGLIQGIERRRGQQQQKQQDTKDIHILAVETDGTQSMNLAMASKELITLPKITSMAVSLACVRVSEKTFEYCLSPPPGIEIHSVVLSDADAARGCLRLADDERILVELACGVCIEAVVGDAHASNIQKALFEQQQQQASQIKNRARPISKLKDEGYYEDDQQNEYIRDTKSRKTVNDFPSSCPSDSGFASDTDSDSLLSARLTPSHLRRMIPNLTPESRVVIIVCGGSNVTTGLASEWREKLANGWM